MFRRLPQGHSNLAARFHPRSANASGQFRPDIHGLRGLAILSVVFGHAVPGLLPGGFTGVDVFFVISGYLISRIVLSQSERGRFHFLSFYQQRIRRIVPALVVMVVACGVVGALLLPPGAFAELGRNITAAALLVPNFQAYRSTGYFDGLREWKPLLHLWTIGVEAQFYLLWPPILLTFRRWFGQHLWIAILAGALTSLTLSEYWTHANPNAAFFLAPSRGFEFAIGAAVALAPKSAFRERHGGAASLAGLVMIAAGMIFLTPQVPYPGLAALVPCCGAGLIAWSSDAQGIGGRILAFRPLFWVGTISYSLYLWHWPLLAFGRIALGPDFGPAAIFMLLAASVVVASASFAFVERPFLETGEPAKRIWIGSALSAVVLLAVGLSISGADGWPGRFSSEALRALAAEQDYSPARRACHNNAGPPRMYGKNCWIGNLSRRPDVAVYGDSMGVELAYVLGQAAMAQNRSVMEVTSTGCPPAQRYRPFGRPNCEAWNANMVRALAADRHIKYVILTVAGAYYDNQNELRRGYAETVRALQRAGKTVVLISEAPSYHFEVPETVALRLNAGLSVDRLGIPVESLNEGAYGAWRGYLQSVAKQTGAPIFDPARAICTRAFCQVYDAAAGVLYFDSFHPGVKGTQLMSAALVRALYARETGKRF